jgi:hypothetical protein
MNLVTNIRIGLLSLKRGRPKLTWAEGIRGMMGEKGLKEEDWADRNNWRRKIA